MNASIIVGRFAQREGDPALLVSMSFAGVYVTADRLVDPDRASMSWDAEEDGQGEESIIPALFDEIYEIARSAAADPQVAQSEFEAAVTRLVYLFVSASSTLRDWLLACNLQAEVGEFLKGASNE